MEQALTSKQRFWRDHIQAAKHEQLTYAEYAKRHNLNLKALYYWSMTLRRRGVLEQPAPAFVELKVKRTSSVRPETFSVASARVRLANGVELELSDVKEQTLRWLAAL